MDNRKMTKAAGALDTLFKVAGGILCAVIVICVLFAGLILVYGEKVFVPDSVTMDIGFIKFYLADEYRFMTDNVKLFATVSLATSAVLYGLACYGCGTLRRVLLPMKEGRPFDEGAARELRKVAWLVLGGGLYGQALKIAEHFLMIRAYPLEEIFDSEAIVFMKHIIDVDFSFVLVAAAFFLLSYIFSYGQALQRESDETL